GPRGASALIISTSRGPEARRTSRAALWTDPRLASYPARVLRALVLISVASLASAAAAQPARPGPTIALGGDVLYEAPLDYQLRARAHTIGREAALREVFSELTPALSGADLAVVNLEVP